MKEEFNKEELRIIKELTNLKEEITPPPSSLKVILDSVTNEEDVRYSFSMWKYAIPAVMILVVVAIGGFLYKKHGAVKSPTQQTEALTQSSDVPTGPVTASNADATLQQTDQAIQQDTNQLDQDLNSLNQTNSSEDDLNNI